MSRSVIYEQMRSRTPPVRQARRGNAHHREWQSRPTSNYSKANRGCAMTKRRSRGDGGLYWSEARQRWIAEVTVGYSPTANASPGKRAARQRPPQKTSSRRSFGIYDDGLTIAPDWLQVAQAVNDCIAHGLSGRDEDTVDKIRYLAEKHIIPEIGARKLRALSAEDVDEWLADKAKTLSTRTLRDLHSILRRSVRRAQAREKVKRNVVLLCDCPTGQTGRPSKSLALEQAERLLVAAETDHSTMGAYIIVSLLSGCRTERGSAPAVGSRRAAERGGSSGTDEER